MYCGVDLSPYFREEVKDNGKLWERWTLCLMGAKRSPYQTVKTMLWAEDIVRGEKNDNSNPFRWAYVKLNLPGSKDYDPSAPWVAIACDFFIYVDDVRITGPGESEIWTAIRKLSRLFGHLGIQDAARKRRPPTTRPGAWAGSMVYVDREHVGVYVDQKKWDKIKSHLTWIKEQLNNLNSASDWQVSSEFAINQEPTQ